MDWWRKHHIEVKFYFLRLVVLFYTIITMNYIHHRDELRLADFIQMLMELTIVLFLIVTVIVYIKSLFIKEKQ